jgi:hypothetical protein
MDTPPPFPAQTGPPRKKGLPPLAWAGIGCGVLLVLAVLAGALGVRWFVHTVDTLAKDLSGDARREAVDTAADMLSGVHVVRHDDDAKSVTFRAAGTAGESTLGHEEFLRGEFPVTRADGSSGPAASDPAAVPSWLPAYPAVLTLGGLFLSDTASDAGGILTFTTRDDPDTVAGFYESAFPWANSTSSSSVSMNRTKKLSRSYGEPGRRVSIEISGDGSAPTFVAVTFRE